jgi:hypothetical protein
MRAKVLKRFYDLQSKTLRLPGEEFNTNQERFGEINSTSFGVLVEVVEDKPKAKKGKKVKVESGE